MITIIMLCCCISTQFLVCTVVQNRQIDEQTPQNENTVEAPVTENSETVTDITTETAVDDEKSTEIAKCPVQPADRNLVHVTKAQMKGD